jgi:hypothetical protein
MDMHAHACLPACSASSLCRVHAHGGLASHSLIPASRFLADGGGGVPSIRPHHLELLPGQVPPSTARAARAAPDCTRLLCATPHPPPCPFTPSPRSLLARSRTRLPRLPAERHCVPRAARHRPGPLGRIREGRGGGGVQWTCVRRPSRRCRHRNGQGCWHRAHAVHVGDGRARRACADWRLRRRRRRRWRQGGWLFSTASSKRRARQPTQHARTPAHALNGVGRLRAHARAHARSTRIRNAAMFRERAAHGRSM